MMERNRAGHPVKKFWPVIMVNDSIYQFTNLPIYLRLADIKTKTELAAIFSTNSALILYTVLTKHFLQTNTNLMFNGFTMIKL